MITQQEKNYQRISEAIEYIRLHFKEQPGLEQIAAHVNMSPYHFQRLFSEWAGVSPKQFLQYISISYAKQLLKHKATTLVDVAEATGLSGTGRLHDLFVKIESMTPGEYKNGGLQLTIDYSFLDTPFGKLLVASTAKGICHMAFCEHTEIARNVLQEDFPKAHFELKGNLFHEYVLKIFSGRPDIVEPIKLHLKGSDFQLKVWEALLQIPIGSLVTYGDIAASIQQPKASRAVGTAIGNNPIAFLIPCHRVIQSSGLIGGYMWGPTRKAAIIGWEAVQIHK